MFQKRSSRKRQCFLIKQLEDAEKIKTWTVRLTEKPPTPPTNQPFGNQIYFLGESKKPSSTFQEPIGSSINWCGDRLFYEAFNIKSMTEVVETIQKKSKKC